MSETTDSRIASIDRFRGLCMIAVVIQFIMGALGDTFESWKFAKIIEHDEDGIQILKGVAFADIFAPMFIFIIGITLLMSFNSREKKFGTARAYFDLSVRFLGLMGLGAFFNSIEDGWFDVFTSEDGFKAAFADTKDNLKVFMYASVVVVLLLLINIVASIVKNRKFYVISSSAFRYFLALMGIAVLFFIAVSAADRIIPDLNEEYKSKIFGGYIWDTLENIGFAGLIALPLVKTDKWFKLATVMGYFLFFGAYAQAGGIEILGNMTEGAPFSGFCWAGILILGSFFMDIKENKKLYWSFAIGMTAVAVVLIQVFGLIAVKRGCTPAYALLCSGIGAIIFGLLSLLDNWHPKFSPLSWWGGSSILIYCVTLLSAAVLDSFVEKTFSVTVGLLITAGFLVVYTVVNWLLAKGNKHIKL